MWLYQDELLEGDLRRAAYRSRACIFCRTPLDSLHYESTPVWITPRDLFPFRNAVRTLGCTTCGWWVNKGEQYLIGSRGQPLLQTYVAAGALCNLDLRDLSLPLEEIRNFLTAKYAARLACHPRTFEEVVASVFRSLGFEAVATPYSADGGIDVVLTTPDGTLVGVQVKRYRKSIEVEQIRAFAGALLLGGMTKGVFVTTSSFQRGVSKTVGSFAQKGTAIELRDAPQFFELLKVAQVHSHPLDVMMERTALGRFYANPLEALDFQGNPPPFLSPKKKQLLPLGYRPRAELDGD